MIEAASTNLPSSVGEYLLGRVNIVGDCWEWKGAKRKGYGALTYQQKSYVATRFVFEIHHGRKPVGSVLHSCDNPPCVNPAHLREGTALANSKDAKDRDRIPKGERRYNAILNEEAVKVLLYLRSKGYTYARLAKAYGLSYWTIRSATSGAAWSHLKEST